MAKTRSAEKPEPEDKAAGLEIISIGSLYKGPWDKKYWSSSRGKDRYPYPVGYQATRAYNGTTYKMEIHEGVSGPRFVITSADGYSCSGKTPDIAWEEFQKRGCPRMKIWYGKRLSSKMDGLELFGFKNPFVQRLLRELVADLNGIAEQSLNFCNEISRIEDDDCCQNVCTYPDLLLCLGRAQVTGKRSRCENKNVKLGRTFLKRPRPQEFTCSSIASNIRTKGSLNLGASITHDVSEEEYEAQNHTGASASMHILSSVGESANCFSLKNGLPLNRIDISDDQEGRAVHAERTSGFVDSTNGKATVISDSSSKEGEPLHRSLDAELNTSNFLVEREDEKLLAAVSKESEGCCNIDLYAPDTIDYGQENTSDSAPSTLYKNAYSERAYQITSGEVLRTEHQEEVLTSDLNPNFEKSDFDSGGQDVAKSMMTVLLPQAIPLLKKDSTIKKLTINPSGMLPSIMNSNEEGNKIGNILEPASSVVTENAYVEREEKMYMPNTDLSSIIPSSEHAKIVIADSFEPSQCEDHKSDQAILFSDIAEASRASFNKETCCPASQEQHAGGVLPNESSKCHADINLTKDQFCHISELDTEDLPQDGNVCIPDSVLGHTPPLNRVISESSNDACIDTAENSNQVGLNSMEKDLKATHDFTGDISNAPEKKTQDEVVDKTGNAETMIMPSVQVPNIVYTRRKIRNAAPLTGNCLLAENTRSDKYGELVTSEMNIAKGTLPPSETIHLHMSDSEPCEPVLLGYQARDEVQSDDLQRDNSITSSQIKQSPTVSENRPFFCATKENILCPDDLSVSHVETPPIHSDVLGGYSNLAELNNRISCWNPNPSSCENNCSFKEAQVISQLDPHRNEDLSDNLGRIIKFVGCYILPMPVSSLFLSRRENEILIYVICGPVMDQERTLFAYKVSVKEPNVGCPSFIAYTSLLLPDPKHNFMKETMLERSGMQLTPDGQYIVFLGSIKTPNCRERKICCYCSSCTSVCSEENALKIVQVEHGYVSVVATLRTLEVVHCLLVCEPNQLCSVGESGRLHVWVMNSTWREKIEDFIIPADDSISPGIVELKRVPKCAHLVVGYNGFGEFSLWDISKRNCVSSFSTSTNPINQFLPVSLFNCQTSSLGFSYTSVEEQVDQLLGATRLWFSEHKETSLFLPSEEGDIAMWLLVSTDSDVESPHNCVSSHCQMNTAGTWRLALLMKNNMILGSPFNIRTTAIGVLGSHGIIGACDGLVYIWELSGGSKLGTLHHFQDGTATCIATDESTGGALGVAGGEGRLLVYMHHNELDAQ